LTASKEKNVRVVSPPTARITSPGGKNRKSKQMSKIEKLREQEAETTIDASTELAAFAVAANENRSGFGARLTYIKGKFVFGRDKELLPLGTLLVAIMREVRHGYIKWSCGKIVGASVGRVIDGFKPNRNELGDLDEELWPVGGLSGKQEDPWQKTIYIPMVTPDGATIYTFQTHSFYGREAAYGLLALYASQGADHPGLYPVVELGSAISKSAKFGDVPSPTFKIVDWLGRPQLSLPDSTIKTVVEEEVESAKPEKVIDFDDDVPF
jgi:hypothetical protein